MDVMKVNSPEYKLALLLKAPSLNLNYHYCTNDGEDLRARLKLLDVFSHISYKSDIKTYVPAQTYAYNEPDWTEGAT